MGKLAKDLRELRIVTYLLFKNQYFFFHYLLQRLQSSLKPKSKKKRTPTYKPSFILWNDIFFK